MTQTITLAGHDGHRIVAAVTGPEAGFPVILAHGGGQTRRAWRRTADELAQGGFRSFAIDMRGHGESDWAAAAHHYDLAHYARDAVAIGRGMSRPPAWVGASLGGMAGMVAEGTLSPGVFSSLTLVDIAANVAEDGVDRILGFMGTHVADGFASPEEAAEVIASYLPHRPRRGASESLRHYLREGADGRYRWHWDPKFIEGITDRTGGRPGEMEEAAIGLKLPVHLVRGGKSDLLTIEGARHFRDLVPHTHFTDIADAGHMVVGDRNDAFTAAILDFLSRTHVQR